MDDNLRITSLNCYGLKTSLYQVYELCEISDIVFLQETLLFSHELSMLSTLHPEFEGMGVSAIDSTSGIITGRPFGGVVILIRKMLRQYCNFIFYDDPRITGLEIKCVLDSVHLINVYLPYQCHDNYDDYVEYLGKISAIIEGCATSKLAVCRLTWCVQHHVSSRSTILLFYHGSRHSLDIQMEPYINHSV